MPKLVIYGLHKSLYDSKVACLYLNYMSDDGRVVDHLGRVIGDFYQHAPAFVRHLKNIIVTMLNNDFQKTRYYISDVDFQNQAPFPFLSIHRADERAITKKDLDKIRDVVDILLDKRNKEVEKEASKITARPSRRGLFADRKSKQNLTLTEQTGQEKKNTLTS